LEAGCDAIFAANDYMALGVIRACYELGVNIPEKLAVVGFDDIVSVGYFTPPLTTVRQPFEKIGHHAVELLIDLLQGGGSKRVALSTDLIVRQST
jgi:DNA-binding LacI/PurR family transcriptional regulator